MTPQKRFILFAALILAAIIAAAAPSHGEAADGKRYHNLDRKGVAIKGYDPVAYFTDGKPARGEAQYASTFEGATYHFASAQHQKMFDAEPGKYAVQYGGFCGYAVSKGYTADIDPKQFVIVEGRLVLQNNAGALKLWNKDSAGNFRKANENWPGIVAKKGK